MPRRTIRSRRMPAKAMLAGGGALAALLAGVGYLAIPADASTSSPGDAATADRGDAAPRAYYLALGDSLSQGVQPATPPLPAGVSLGQSIETSQGYPDDLYAHYAPAFHGRLRPDKLGCPGETTTSMLTGAGSPCSYPQGSQLAAALAFLRTRHGQAGLITLDIGANDVDGCAAGGSINQACVATGVAAIGHDLPLILGDLRDAAGPHTRIVAMNLYDPFLADYLTGAAGQGAATESVVLGQQVNELIAADDTAFGAATADVQDAFSTTDFTDTATLPGAGSVPLNVARICEWTWMCAPAPVGPNIHANADGYQVIAGAFEQAIGEFPGGRDHG